MTKILKPLPLVGLCCLTASIVGGLVTPSTPSLARVASTRQQQLPSKRIFSTSYDIDSDEEAEQRIGEEYVGPANGLGALETTIGTATCVPTPPKQAFRQHGA